jgi:hypothetical protein
VKRAKAKLMRNETNFMAFSWLYFLRERNDDDGGGEKEGREAGRKK